MRRNAMTPRITCINKSVSYHADPHHAIAQRQRTPSTNQEAA